MGGVSADGKVVWLSGRFNAEGYAIDTTDGKLQGMPECKVQVRTPLAELPGYDPMT